MTITKFSSAEEAMEELKRERAAQPKIEEVYLCPDCDKEYADVSDAVACCIPPPPPLQFKCLSCGFVWPTMDRALECYEIETRKGR